MLQRKVTTNISELNNFFTSSEKVCETIIRIIRSLKLMTAKELVEKQKRNKKVKRSRKLNVWYSYVDVDFKGNQVRLFFCKTNNR